MSDSYVTIIEKQLSPESVEVNNNFDLLLSDPSIYECGPLNLKQSETAFFNSFSD